MLGSRTKAKQQEKTAPSGGAQTENSCVIAAGTIIEGIITTTEGLRMDGEIKGEVRVGKNLVMGKQSKVEGNVTSKDAYVAGKIEGTIIADGNLNLRETASVDGKIQARQLTVEQGASYNGECHIGDQHFKNK